MAYRWPLLGAKLTSQSAQLYLHQLMLGVLVLDLVAASASINYNDILHAYPVVTHRRLNMETKSREQVAREQRE